MRLCEIAISMRAKCVQKLLRGRCIPRPCFDIAKSERNDVKSYAKVVGNFRNSWCPIRNALTLRHSDNVFLLGTPETVPTATYSASSTMALNKLSIDKVDLTNKRVLIRYVPLHCISSSFLLLPSHTTSTP